MLTRTTLLAHLRDGAFDFPLQFLRRQIRWRAGAHLLCKGYQALPASVSPPGAVILGDAAVKIEDAVTAEGKMLV